MAGSLSGRSSAALRLSGGFSLLELLVALMVVVLITSMVSLSVGSGGQDVKLEATVRQLADVAVFALDEAQLSGQDHGLLFEEELVEGGSAFRYRWLQRELDGWQPTPDVLEVFDSARLPPEITVEMELEDALYDEIEASDDDIFDEDGAEEGLAPPLRPQIVLYASGETTPGALNFRLRDSDDLLWRLEWDLLGRFDVMRRGELAEDEL